MKGLPLQLQVATQSTGADVNADVPYSAIVRYPFLYDIIPAEVPR
jgi:hypothetical protein